MYTNIELWQPLGEIVNQKRGILNIKDKYKRGCYFAKPKNNMDDNF